MTENLNYQESEAITIVDALNIILNGKFIIIATIIIGIILGGCFSYNENRNSLATSVSTIELKSSKPDRAFSDSTLSILKSDAIAATVKKDLNLPSNASLGIIKTTYTGNGFFKIYISNKDFELANKINSEMIKSYQDHINNSYRNEYEQNKSIIMGNISSLEDSFKEFNSDEKNALLTELLRLTTENTEKLTMNIIFAPKATIEGVSYKRNIVLGLILGLVAGVVLVFLRNWWITNKDLLKTK